MNAQGIRKMRFWLVLPVLVIPFITAVFWLMGDGKKQGTPGVRPTGLNTRLPDARVAADSGKDKLAFYAQADQDSAKHAEALRNDPYLKMAPAPAAVEHEIPVEEKVQKIRSRIKSPLTDFDALPVVEHTTQVVPLKTPVAADPELEAINQTLDKLAALQHPGKMAEKRQVAPDNALTVSVGNESDDSYFGRRDTTTKQSKFFEANSVYTDASCSAIIPVSQTLQAGSVVKLQLSKPISVAGRTIAAGALLYGIAAVEGERLLIRIPSVRAAETIYPVALSVYDLDGMEGIYVPGSISREVLKSTAEQSLGSVNVLSLDPSIKTQAVMAGVGAAKNLLSKKAKLVRVTLAAGYRVLLRNEKEK